MLRLGWFTTGRGEGSRALFENARSEIERGGLDAEIEFVFCNREYGENEPTDRFLDLVKENGLPLVSLSSRRWRREHGGGPFSEHRIAFHREVLRLIADYRPDLCVFAGYMLLTSPEVVDQYKLINLHAALPGTTVGTWQQVIWKLIEDDATESGVTIHVATAVLDKGPTIAYCTYPIRGSDFDGLWTEIRARSIEEIKSEGEEQPLFARIRGEGRRREVPLLLETLRALASDRIQIKDRRVLDSDGEPSAGVCLDDEVDRYLASR